MSIQVYARVAVRYIGNGVGPFEMVPGAQSIIVQTPLTLAAGGDAPTAAQMAAAFAAVAAAANTQLQAQLGTIQQWGIGGP